MVWGLSSIASRLEEPPILLRWCSADRLGKLLGRCVDRIRHLESGRAFSLGFLWSSAHLLKRLVPMPRQLELLPLSRLPLHRDEPRLLAERQVVVEDVLADAFRGVGPPCPRAENPNKPRFYWEHRDQKRPKRQKTAGSSRKRLAVRLAETLWPQQRWRSSLTLAWLCPQPRPSAPARL